MWFERGRMMRWIGSALVLGAAMMATPALAQAEGSRAALKPAMPWAIDYADDSCRVFRKFGTGAEQVELVFITLPRSSGATLIVITSPEKGPGPRHTTFGTVRVGLRPGGKVINTQFASAPMGDGQRRLLHFRLDAEQLEQVIAANGISIDGGELHVALEAGRTAAAFKALEPCHEDLVKSWDIDPEILRNAVHRAAPTGKPQQWVTQDDYPEIQLRRRVRGVTTFRVTVGTNGRVSECAIVVSSKSKPLDDRVCELMRLRARFTPARDARRAAVPDIWIGRFIWDL